MSINSLESYNNTETIKSFESMQEAIDYLLELMKQICIENLICKEEDWWFYPSRYCRGGSLLLYRSPEQAEKELQERRIDFTEKIEALIIERANKVFKNGLKEKQEKSPLKIEVLPPTGSQLEKINSGEIESVLRFTVTRHLTPRYIKDGDKGEYTLVFELYVSELSYNSNILKKSNAVINCSNRQLKIGIVSPLKISPETVERDASAKRSADAYRRALMRVINVGSFSNR